MSRSEIKKIIAYYRVSTEKQGKSGKKRGQGLGLEAQKEAINKFARDNKATIAAEYREVESGRHTDRVELMKALAHARLLKATLVVARLDRLSRNAAFTSQLLESEVDFVCCDNPHANRFTIHILAAVAENESRATSSRTKQALAQAKKDGTLLGSARPGHWDGREDKRGWKQATKQAGISRSQRAKKTYELLLPKMQEWRAKEGLTYEEIAMRLNQEDYPTSTGSKFTTATVWRILNGYPQKKKKKKSARKIAS